MQAKPECDRCFLRQARDATRRIGLDNPETEIILDAVRVELARTPTVVTPPVRASGVHALIREMSGNPDPYREAKQQATTHALSLYPDLKALVAGAREPLDTAVRLAIAGNIIDLGVSDKYDLEASIERTLAQPFAINDMEALRFAIERADNILYLADNAGETVFDRLFIEILEQPVTYVVKGGAAVNDATREDAEAAGLAELCTVIDSGAATLGTLLDQCSPQLQTLFCKADLIIAKGMANYESLSGSRGEGLFFLLQAKCGIVADHLGVGEKSIIIMQDIRTDLKESPPCRPIPGG